MRREFRDRVPEETLTPPDACPACKSKELTTASKTVSVDSYWRCLSCGEVWNAQRNEAASRYRTRYR